MDQDPAHSTIGNILMIVICIIILAIILLACLGLCNFGWFSDTLAPPLFKITSISHGTSKSDGFLIIKNTDSLDYPNRDLISRFYSNEKLLFTGIYTLNGHDFIPTAHYGVQYIGGEGTCGALFAKNEMMKVNLKNGLIHPGDMVEMRMYLRSENGRNHVFDGLLTDQKYVEEWLGENLNTPIKGYHLISQHKIRA